MRKKYSIEDIKKIAKERGGECLSNEYVNNHTKLKWRCSEGHEWEATSSNVINNDSWCPICAGNIPSSIEEMKEIAGSRGGECLSDDYVNAHSKLKWKCSTGHEWDAIPDSIKRGSWCPICAGKIPLTIEEMKEIAKNRGGLCLSDEYINDRTKLKWRCSEDHEWEAIPTHIKRGSWCPICAGKIPLTIEEMKEIAKNRGGECLSSEYINYTTKLKWKCSEGHEWEASPSHIKRGEWCPYCGIGLGEEITRRMFELLFNNSFPRVRPKWLINPLTGKRMELDGYCEELLIAFEYQGEQHYKYNDHFYKNNESFIRRKQDDQQKRTICNKKGIRLIEIPYYIEFIDLPKYIISECNKAGVRVKNIPIEIYDYKSFNEVYISGNIERMKEIATSHGGKCLSENYINAKTKLLWKCSRGHTWKAVPDSIVSGTWCPICGKNKSAIKRKLTIQEMREIAKSRGGIYLSEIYVNANTTLKWKCSEGHQWEATPGNIKSGKWCPICAGNICSSIEEMNEIARSRGGECLSEEYVNAHSKIKWKCSEGHEWEASPNNIKRGRWCPICARSKKKKE